MQAVNMLRAVVALGRTRWWNHNRSEDDVAVGQGASTDDIQFHYDLSRNFYRLWLDETMTYSCAMFDGQDDLVEAQLRKLDYHIAQAEIMPSARVLDIGCGWGSLMLRIMEQVPDALCVGLTLSKDQKAFVDDKRIQGIDVRLASWAELQDTAAFDAVISIGAMEHFAQPGLTSDEKTAIYRGFFKKVRQALKPGGWLSLQTITFDRLQEAEFRSFITERIFPGSMLPRPAEVISAADRVLSLVNCRNDARDYARTCRVWAGRLERSRDGAIAAVGEEKVSDYIQYLRMSAAAFERSGFGLYRLKFRSYPEN